MKSSELAKLGIHDHEAQRLASMAIAAVMKRGVKKKNVAKTVRGVAASPKAHLAHADFGALAAYLLQEQPKEIFNTEKYERDIPAPFQVWGADIDEASLDQMRNACMLPVAARGAVMPDAHVGYGLPIGGVLATRNAVIPYAVGVDIACRMKLTMLDLPVQMLKGESEKLLKTLREETHFGPKAFGQQREHDVMDEDWSITSLTSHYKDKAYVQLGTSGGGNHFVEFGELIVEDESLEIPAGTYLALLSHSGSRGTGAMLADHYSKLAMAQHEGLPKQLKHLAWLDLDSAEGQEYWACMQLMGKYAAANHACIHSAITKALGAESLVSIENHHNFAWLEEHETEPGKREKLIVHRKGATPAGENVLGVIPGSMATPAFVVCGKGNGDSLNSASHGAGRLFSRRVAKESITRSAVKRFLADQGVTLLSGGLDEAPMAYKNIHTVMAAQRDLVEPLAQFNPKLVRMASD